MQFLSQRKLNIVWYRQHVNIVFFSGDVVTLDCVERIIKKNWIHPLTNQKLTEKDIIIMQRVTNYFT